MIIIHGMNDRVVPRFLGDAVARAARTMPVVVVTGARQTGKSTLVRTLLQAQLPYLTLDDLDVLEQARRAPDELLARGEALVLDEVQRAPELLSAVKRAVDAQRRPGRFILTGSANLLLMRRVSESLAGRAAYLNLWPLTVGERHGLGAPGRWSALFEHPPQRWPDLFAAASAVSGLDWRHEVRRGGYPVPALALPTEEDRAIWFDGYVRTYLERDLQDLSAIDNLVDFRRLMRAVCLRRGQVLNQSELGRDVQLPQPTVRRWLNLLETSYQLVRVPAYAVNRTKRLIKSPKAYWCDTGLALYLAGDTEPDGADLENMVLQDLLAWRDAHLARRPELHYWRTVQGEEVDFVVEANGWLLALEVKVGTRPGTADARHLVSFRDEYGDRVRGCLLVHGGQEVTWLARHVLAVPWHALLSPLHSLTAR